MKPTIGRRIRGGLALVLLVIAFVFLVRGLMALYRHDRDEEHFDKLVVLEASIAAYGIVKLEQLSKARKPPQTDD